MTSYDSYCHFSEIKFRNLYRFQIIQHSTKMASMTSFFQRRSDSSTKVAIFWNRFPASISNHLLIFYINEAALHTSDLEISWRHCIFWWFFWLQFLGSPHWTPLRSTCIPWASCMAGSSKSKSSCYMIFHIYFWFLFYPWLMKHQ